MEKKSIYTITYHRAFNYGAVLQAYATVIFFERLGYDAKIIDYIPESLHGFGTFKNAYNQVDNKKHNFIMRIILSAIKTPSNKRLKKVFTKFVDNNLKLTRKYYSMQELVSNKPIADIYCSGSDQVWNNYYSTNFEKAYFLDFASKDDICISLSSSFGKEEFNAKEKEYIKKSLSKYSLLSVREMEGKSILDSLNLKPNLLTYDPTLLIDYKYWERLIGDISQKDKTETDKYILLYQLHGDSDAYEKAIEFSKKKGLKVIRIITMYHQIKKDCQNIIIPDVPRFLKLIKNAEYVFTDSFHGTVFSIIFKKKVGVRLPIRFGNRITSLLYSLNASEIIISNLSDWNSKVTNDYMVKVNENMNLNRNRMVDIYSEQMTKIID